MTMHRLAVWIVLTCGCLLPGRLIAQTPGTPPLSEEQQRQEMIRKAQEALQKAKMEREQKEAATEAKETAAAAAGPAPVELDLQTLMTDPNVLNPSIADAVWKFTAPTGRRILMIPFNVKPVTSPTPIDIQSIKITRGRMLAWDLPDEVNHALATGSSNDLQMIPPNVTTSATVHPQKMIAWELARRVTFGEATDANQAYVIVVNRAALPRPEPPQVERLGSKERAAAMVTYREQLDAYNRKIRLATQLPTEFSKPTPPVIWAIFDLPSTEHDIELTGPEPLPWRISIDLLERIKRATNNANPLELGVVINDLLSNDHPYNQRMAAMLLASSTNLRNITADSPLVPTVEKLVTKGDALTRTTLIKALAADITGIPIASAMLTRAMADADPQIGLIAMQAQSTAATETTRYTPDQIHAMAENTTRLLADAADQPPANILAVPLSVAAKQYPTVAPFAEQVKLAATPAARRDEVVKTIVDRAAKFEPLAEAWLSDQLLGGTDMDYQLRTLKYITTPEVPGTRLSIYKPDHGLIKLLTAPAGPLRDLAWKALPYFALGAATNRTSAAPTEVVANDKIYAGFINAVLTVKPTPRQLVEFIDAQSAQDLRTAAMQRIALESTGPSAMAAMQTFITGGFPTWLTKLTPDQRQQAARVWYERYPEPSAATPPPGGDAPKIEPDMTAPLAAGLIRPDPQTAGNPTPMITWFSEQVSKRLRPTARDWAAALGDQDVMIMGIVNADKDYGLACADAMLATVTYPTPDQSRSFQTQALAAAGNIADPIEQKQTLLKVWKDVREKIVADQLAKAPGAYRIALRLDGGAVTQLGATNLAVNGENILIGPPELSAQLVSVPIAIRLNNLAQINALTKAAGIEGEFTFADNAVLDLEPDGKGGWAGRIMTTAGKVLELTLTKQ
ncbi:MAG: hypothetical protein GC162_05235 [Planctomycetes bacterium]|nr:hypothetical protein [Planctomycetota bacterium]